MVHTNLNAMLKFKIGKSTMRIPIRVGSFVTEAKARSPFNNFCKHCNNQINRIDICKNPDCKAKELTKDDIAKVFVYGKGDIKVVDKDLIAEISTFERTINVKGSLPKSHTTVTLGGNYILPREFDPKEGFDPEEDQEPFEAYRMLHSALTNGQDLVVEFQRKRFKIAILRAIGSVVTMLTIPFQESVRPLDEQVDVKVSREEKQEAKQWIDKISQVDVGSIVDRYRENIEKIITGEIKPKKKSGKGKTKPTGKRVSFFLVPKEFEKVTVKKLKVKGGKK